MSYSQFFLHDVMEPYKSCTLSSIMCSLVPYQHPVRKGGLWGEFVICVDLTHQLHCVQHDTNLETALLGLGFSVGALGLGPDLGFGALNLSVGVGCEPGTVLRVRIGGVVTTMIEGRLVMMEVRSGWI